MGPKERIARHTPRRVTSLSSQDSLLPATCDATHGQHVGEQVSQHSPGTITPGYAEGQSTSRPQGSSALFGLDHTATHARRAHPTSERQTHHKTHETHQQGAPKPDKHTPPHEEHPPGPEMPCQHIPCAP